MCGFAGYWNLLGQEVDQDLLGKMINPLAHRGPDDQGTFIKNNLGFSHARLSIHDLSSAGFQPKFSASGRWLIIFNGEIYNYQEIKRELLTNSTIQFNSSCDTEVLINAIEYWGVENALKRSIGMFAFAAFDFDNQELYLARDRFGEKPLYYSIQNQICAFASELKALKALTQLGFSFTVDRSALASYMRFAYVPTPNSIYERIYKLESGCILKINNNGQQTKSFFWQPKNMISAPRYSGTYEDAVSALESQLLETLNLQMQADVPLGAFLSGGVDSSAIVALMQSLSREKINTFSIGFEDAAYNEAEYAREVAKHLNTEHTNLYVTEKEAQEVIFDLPELFDEPFADSSQIPTYIVSKLARTKVSVSLTGDGGDELFGGYNRHLMGETVFSRFIKAGPFRVALQCLPESGLNLLGRLPSSYARLSDKLRKIKLAVKKSGRSKEAFYHFLCSQVYDDNLVLGAKLKADTSSWFCRVLESLSYPEWMMLVDSQTYMMDDVLTKVDRSAMAVSLETRVPFLDHRVFELAWRLPLSYKIHRGRGKRVLRDVLYRYVPQALIDRPKMGFAVPMARWLRGDLKTWAEGLLNAKKIRAQGFLNDKAVMRYWQEHQSGRRDWADALWTILMFQLWHERWME